jgi:ribosomal protein S24E
MKNISILHDKKNVLMEFRDVSLEAVLEKTPTKAEALRLISDNFKASEENCIIKKILGGFGTGNFTIHARIYPNVQIKTEFEVKNKKKKKKAA